VTIFATIENLVKTVFVSDANLAGREKDANGATTGFRGAL
jgi:hypothetical protein